MSASELYVCIRTSDLKEAPGGLKGKCSDCGCDVWQKPYAPTHIKIICNHCLPKYINESFEEGQSMCFVPGNMAPRKYSS